MQAASPKPNIGAVAALKKAYRLRWKRRRLLFRSWRKRRQLSSVQDRTNNIGSDAILAFFCVRNEALRLPYFLQHYRDLGVDHFLCIDNGSDDGTEAYLASQPDVSVWHTSDSYRLSRFGMDWLGWLQMQYAHGHWCLTVDADELLTFPYHDTHGLDALTAWLDRQGRRSLGALMLDMYPEGPVGDQTYTRGTNPIDNLTHFDADNYRSQWHRTYGNLWIQGGVRGRVFFSDEPARAPTLNKVPLVKWNRRYSYVTSTHQILPPALHDVFGTVEQPKMTGVLLHTKFLHTIAAKSREELARKQHFENSELYAQYHKAIIRNPTLWHPESCRYTGWEQLAALGLMSKEDWV